MCVAKYMTVKKKCKQQIYLAVSDTKGAHAMDVLLKYHRHVSGCVSRPRCCGVELERANTGGRGRGWCWEKPLFAGRFEPSRCSVSAFVRLLCGAF